MHQITRRGFDVTLDDFYCGMGGETTGAKAAGLTVRNCFNHWDLAIEVHNLNHPEAIHIKADIGKYDVHGYKPSVAAWFSPECKTFSQASGISQYKLKQSMLPGFEQYDLTPAQQRSRVTAGDILRHVQVHRYEWFIVENVVQFRDWEKFDDWLQEIINFGYEWQIVYLNSMFCHPTPQSRDRFYLCAWRKGNKKPNLDIRPRAYCENCLRDTDAVQSWKSTRTVAWGRYGDQYVYVCSNCTRTVQPYYYAAANVIDWTNIGTRIGDREKPLSPKTMKRIEAGIKRFASAIVETAYTKTTRRPYALYEPLPTQTTQQSLGVFMTRVNHWTDLIRMAWEAMPTQTTSEKTAVVFPFISSYHNDESSRSREVGEPLPTVDTNPRFALVTPFITTANTNSVYRDVEESLPAITTIEKHGLVTPFIVSSKLQTVLVGADEPLSTITTVNGQATLIPNTTPVSRVDDAYFRMLTTDEIKRAMGFPSDYQMVGNSKDRTKLAGHAVTPPAAKVLCERMMETLQ